MSKVQFQALVFMQQWGQKDPKCVDALMALSARTGLDHMQCLMNIELISMGMA